MSPKIIYEDSFFTLHNCSSVTGLQNVKGIQNSVLGFCIKVLEIIIVTFFFFNVELAVMFKNDTEIDDIGCFP